MTEESPYLVPLRAALGELPGKVASADLWKILDLPPGAHRPNREKRYLAAATAAMGFRRALVNSGGLIVRGYARGPKPRRQLLVFRDPISQTLTVAYADAPHVPLDPHPSTGGRPFAPLLPPRPFKKPHGTTTTTHRFTFEGVPYLLEETVIANSDRLITRIRPARATKGDSHARRAAALAAYRAGTTTPDPPPLLKRGTKPRSVES
jgi:hypothetical protein